MLPTDSRSRWDDHILNDPRVVHLWDQQRVAGRWFAEHHLADGPIAWDRYLLFPPEGRWEDRPPVPIGGGAPVVGVIDQLEAELTPLLDRGALSAPRIGDALRVREHS